jgi:hypothetical protein
MLAHVTSAAWGQEKRDALIAVGALLGFGILTLAISTVVGTPLFVTFLTVVGGFFIFMFGGNILNWLLTRNAGGTILLDCGPHPMKWFLLPAAVFVFLSGLGLGVTELFHGARGLTMVAAVLYIMLAIWNLLQALSRVQVREKGIWHHGGLLRWEKIESYEWRDVFGCTLRCEYKARLPIFAKAALFVPKECKTQFDELLKKHTVQNNRGEAHAQL